jgi:hypothetical protein
VKIKPFLIFMVFGICLSSSFAYQSIQLTDDQIRQQIIQQSISQYRGSCPCPYSVARNGSSCGGRSAYSRAGGYQPKCYPKDVSAAEVNKVRGIFK